MPTPPRDRRRAPFDRDADPLASFVSDSMRSSVRAAASMSETLRDTMGVRARSPAPPATDDQGRRLTGAAALIDQVARLMADFLDQAGGVAQNVATGIDERTWRDPSAPPVKELELHTPPGATVRGKFTIWNRGDTKLELVRFVNTSLLGPGGQEIVADSVTFEPDTIERVAPRQGEEVVVAVKVPAEITPGIYHGLARATRGNASVLLHVEVKGAPAWPADTPKPSHAPSEDIGRPVSEMLAREDDTTA
jgi:hypothetical protein